MRARVLVVEDELLIGLQIEDMLAEIGCIVIGPVPSVARALALLDREELDFAILDVNLGRERSTPVAQALRARGVPYALATGFDSSQLPEDALKDVPNLGKPLDQRRLAGALAHLRGAAEA